MSRRSTIGLVAAVAGGHTLPDVDAPLLTAVDFDIMRTVGRVCRPARPG